jgi:hypothetical protein
MDIGRKFKMGKGWALSDGKLKLMGGPCADPRGTVELARFLACHAPASSLLCESVSTDIQAIRDTFEVDASCGLPLYLNGNDIATMSHEAS